MTPAKRSADTPASQGPARAAPAREVPTVSDPPPVPPSATPGGDLAPDVPTAPPDAPVPDELVIAPVPLVETEDGAKLLGPDGEPITEAAPTADAGGGSAPPTETAPVDLADRSTPPSPGRSRALHPERVWPD